MASVHTTPSSVQDAALAGGAGPGGMSPEELAELLGTFRDATTRLEGTHNALRSQVARLEGELRETRRRLRRAQELAALGEMAAGIAHEIRNPLGSIKLYAQVLESDLEDASQEHQTASKIVCAVDRLNAVVGDVLAFSREMRVRTEPVEAAELIEAAIGSCSGAVPAGAAFEVHPSVYETSAALVCDRQLMHQALVNVVRNACDALAEAGANPGRGGRSTIEVGLGHRRVLGEDGVRRDMRTFFVRDTGPGIPEDVMQRLFNPFFTTRATGTGLGLAIVHRIMDAHDGSVRIDTAPSGTTVELLLPAAAGVAPFKPHTHDARRAAPRAHTHTTTTTRGTHA